MKRAFAISAVVCLILMLAETIAADPVIQPSIYGNWLRLANSSSSWNRYILVVTVAGLVTVPVEFLVWYMLLKIVRYQCSAPLLFLAVLLANLFSYPITQYAGLRLSYLAEAVPLIIETPILFYILRKRLAAAPALSRIVTICILANMLTFLPSLLLVPKFL